MKNSVSLDFEDTLNEYRLGLVGDECVGKEGHFGKKIKILNLQIMLYIHRLYRLTSI